MCSSAPGIYVSEVTLQREDDRNNYDCINVGEYGLLVKLLDIGVR